jgi:hypothetical protein
VTAQEQIAKLESLLERIRRNAEKPRPAVRAPVRAEAAPVVQPPPVVQVEPARVVEPVAIAEEVSLDSLGATETSPAPRERVQSADMDDLEIVEIGSEAIELQGQSLDEPVPESAPRPAVQSVEVEVEPPVKTPPPESGRQAVTPPPPVADTRDASSDDDFDDDDLLQPDLSGAPISIATQGSPTAAQLGGTVKIPGASEPPTELETEEPSTRAPVASAEIEIEQKHTEVRPEQHDVPSRRVDPLASTVPDMRTALSLAKTAPDLRSPFADAIRATTEAKAEASPSADVAREPAESPAVRAASGPALVVERPTSATTHAAEVVVAPPRKMPETFVELLDASLALHA